MTEIPRQQRPEPDEPSSGSTQFTPGTTAAGAQPATDASSSATAAGTSRTGGAPSSAGPPDSAGTPAAGSGGADSVAPATSADNPLGRTRVSGIWVGIIIFAIVLILLLVFVLQNTMKVSIHYLGFNGHISLAVAMLLSAVAGVLLTAIAGTLRILQLRKRLKANTS